MSNVKEGTKLAELMVSIGNLAGRKVYAILTNMDEPLGNNIGNTLEVIEAIDTLKGKGPNDLKVVVYEIAKLLLEAADIAKGDAAVKLLDEKN